MFKNLFILACILLLSNCTTPTSAFLGPIFTGAKTGSVYQASLSYGSNRIINKMREVTQNNFQEMNSLNSDLSTDDRNPLVLVAYKVSKIEIVGSPVFEINNVLRGLKTLPIKFSA